MEKFIIKKYLGRTFTCDASPGHPGLNHSEITIYGEYPNKNQRIWKIRRDDIVSILGSPTKLHVLFSPMKSDGNIHVIVVTVITDDPLANFLEPDFLCENNELYFETISI